jgi:hypothetical protein
VPFAKSKPHRKTAVNAARHTVEVMPAHGRRGWWLFAVGFDFLRARENPGARMTCDAAREALLACGVGRPLVPGVVRDSPVACGPDVAPAVPSGRRRRSAFPLLGPRDRMGRARQGRSLPWSSRAWKACPTRPSSRDAAPRAQVSSSADQPLLTVRNRQTPVLRAHGGHGRRGPTQLAPGATGVGSGDRQGSFRGDLLPRWQACVGKAGAHGLISKARDG